MESQTFEYSALLGIEQTLTKAFQLMTHKIRLPESTVKTAAKALSLSPSMTLLEWTSSKHMRLNPTTSRTMYNISDTSDSHSIPAKYNDNITLNQMETLIHNSTVSLEWCSDCTFNTSLKTDTNMIYLSGSSCS